MRHTHTLTRTELERSTSRSFSISMHASCSVWTGLFHRFRFPPFFWCVAFNEICCSIAARCSAKPPPKFRHKTTRFRLHFEDLFFVCRNSSAALYPPPPTPTVRMCALPAVDSVGGRGQGEEGVGWVAGVTYWPSLPSYSDEHTHTHIRSWQPPMRGRKGRGGSRPPPARPAPKQRMHTLHKLRFWIGNSPPALASDRIRECPFLTLKGESTFALHQTLLCSKKKI